MQKLVPGLGRQNKKICHRVKQNIRFINGGSGGGFRLGTKRAKGKNKISCFLHSNLLHFPRFLKTMKRE